MVFFLIKSNHKTNSSCSVLEIKQTETGKLSKIRKLIEF